MPTTGTARARTIANFTAEKSGHFVSATYEHPWAIRFTHWVSAICLFVLIGSGLQIFQAFPYFGAKVWQNDLINFPDHFTPRTLGGWLKGASLGGWLAGAEQWHFAFMWIFIVCGIVYLAYQFTSGRYRMVLFTPKDIPGVWPMVRHYFLFGKKPPLTEEYNPLQKLAYTSAILLGIVSVISGLVLYNPVQFSWIGWIVGGFHYARLVHFIAMWAFVAFIFGHLLMVVLHGWSNFIAMLTGWKKDPEYLRSRGNQ